MNRTHHPAAPHRCIPLLALALLLVLGLQGCITTRSNLLHYTLAADPVEKPQHPHPGLTLGIGPVEIPELIDRREIVVRREAGRVDLLSSHLWAGSLREEITHALAVNLASRIGTEQIHFFPFRGTEVDLQIRVRLLELSGAPGSEARLVALWSTEYPASSSRNRTAQSHYRMLPEGARVSDLVATYSQLLGRLATEITQQITTPAAPSSP